MRQTEILFIHQFLTNLAKALSQNQLMKRYISIIGKLIENGAEGIILGCTEIPLLIQQKDVAVPIFDTTQIHSTF
jgi:aspartate racemase